MIWKTQDQEFGWENLQFFFKISSFLSDFRAAFSNFINMLDWKNIEWDPIVIKMETICYIETRDCENREDWEFEKSCTRWHKPFRVLHTCIIFCQWISTGSCGYPIKTMRSKKRRHCSCCFIHNEMLLWTYTWIMLIFLANVLSVINMVLCSYQPQM